ncbi:MAG: YraN family protein, partial [Verrucomicrobiaceae bacterium]
MSSSDTRDTEPRSIFNVSALTGLVQSIAGHFSQFSRRFSRSERRKNAAHELGRRGERLAAKYLKRHGYKILYRNYRASGGGEIDLVCRERAMNTLVFVEVKTRSGTDFGMPADAVNKDKQRLIIRGALSWLRLLDRPDIHFRFDIVEVLVLNGV